MSSYYVAVDIGGTFTDVVVQDTDSGELWTNKVPSTPRDHSIGFMEGIRRGLSLASAHAGEVSRIFHGTTIATNAVIQRTPSKVALITTKGFKYVLEIGRHDIPRRENIYAWVKPERPVPPNLIFEVTERIDRTGTVQTPLDEQECFEIARKLRGLDIEAIAICLLYSYANPVHETRVAEIVLQEFPDAMVSLSTEVLPQFREFERTVATVLNAYVMPRVGKYLSGLDEIAKRDGLEAPLFIMKSNGGITSASMAGKQAIHTVLSGPVAGVMGALEVAKAAGYSNFISVDVGGTSADICLVKEGAPDVTVERMIGGLPLQLPMLDISTIGAGGGSIARIPASGGLTVGPESAGADPGPACYGQGGDEPTVTDAHLVLGHLPDQLINGEMSLDVEAAREAIETKIAGPMGLSLMDAASGILEIADNNMAGAIRAVSIGRGHAPRDFVLVAFGGAGPLHACSLADLLGIETIVVPPTPGVLSTFGLLFTDLKNDYVQTYVGSGGDADVETIAKSFESMEQQARDWLAEEGVAADAGVLARSADLRYEHQGWEITVDVPDGEFSSETLNETIAGFHSLHERLYTYNLPRSRVELVNLRVSASGIMPRHAMVESEDAGGRLAKPTTRRKVEFNRAKGPQDTPIYARETLLRGMSISGPAVVQQQDTTVLVSPGFVANVDRTGNLIIERQGVSDGR